MKTKANRLIVKARECYGKQGEIYRQETHRWKEALRKAEQERDQARAENAEMRKLMEEFYFLSFTNPGKENWFSE